MRTWKLADNMGKDNMVIQCRYNCRWDAAFPVAVSRTWNSLPLHVTSAPSLQTFWKRGWSRYCSSAVSNPNLLFPTAATLLLALQLSGVHYSWI